MAEPSIKELLESVAEGNSLAESGASAAFEYIMSGQATPVQIGGLLMALRTRGESIEELCGAVRVMRSRVLPIQAPPGAIDTCGTGGDASGSYNISTAAALVVAACGVPVAKHGNRSASSRCGAAEVLAQLGLNIECDLKIVERCLWKHGFGFLMAPRHHPSMRSVASVRCELGVRTIFNLIGPLSNPAAVERQLVGVFSPRWVEPIAQALRQLGCKAAWVVHGEDGLDELTTTASSHVAQLRDGVVTAFAVTPDMAGLSRAHPQDLKGGNAKTNAAALWSVLDGTRGAYRDIVLLNSAAALIVAGQVVNLPAGVARAREAIDSGRAKNLLERVVALTNAHSLEPTPLSPPG